MYNNRYTIGDGRTYHHPLKNDVSLSAVSLTEEVTVEHSFFAFGGDAAANRFELHYFEQKVRRVPEAELPSWSGLSCSIDAFGTNEIVAVIENGKLQINNPEKFTTDACRSWSDYEVLVSFAMKALAAKDPFIHNLLSSTTYPGSQQLAAGIVDMVVNPNRYKCFNDMLTQGGELNAMRGLSSKMKVGTGKKTGILSASHFASLKTLDLTDSTHVFQDLIQGNVMSHEDIDRLLQKFKVLIKMKLITKSELRDLIARYEKSIIDNKIDLEIVFNRAYASAFNFSAMGENTGYSYYHRTLNENPSLRYFLCEYLDGIGMLPKEMASVPKNYRGVKDVERFHSVASVRNDVYANPRPVEFEEARVRLRKLEWEDSEYHFRPFANEKELCDTAIALHNCLVSYRDKIIKGAVLVAAFKKLPDGAEEKIPEFVMEFTPYLDVLEISGYNNAEIVDPERLAIVGAFRKAKWYLLSNGRNVYREPDIEKVSTAANVN